MENQEETGEKTKRRVEKEGKRRGSTVTKSKR